MDRSLVSSDVTRTEELEMRILLSGFETRMEHFIDQRLKEMSDQQLRLHEQLISKISPTSPRGPRSPRPAAITVHDRTESQSSLWPAIAGLGSARDKTRKKLAPSLAELESALMPEIGTMRKVPSEGCRSRMQSCSGDILGSPSLSVTSVLPRAQVEPPKQSPALLPGATGPMEPTLKSDPLDLQVDALPEEGHEGQEDGRKRTMGRKVTQFTDKGQDMQDMLRNSQAVILVDCQQNRELADPPAKPWQPYATHAILGLPRAIFYSIGFLTLCQVASMISFMSLGYANSRSLSFSVTSSIIYGLVALCCVGLLRRALKSEQLQLSLGRLHEFVADFEVNWHEVSGKEWRKFALAWLVSVLCFAGTQALELGLWQQDTSTEVRGDDMLQAVIIALKGLSVVNFAIASAIVMMVAYIQSNLLIGLDKSLDCWCCEILNEQDFALGVHSWNALQALLKCVGRELQNSFLALQAFGYLSCVLFLGGAAAVALSADFAFLPLLVEVLAVLPLTMLFLVNLRLFSHGAALTEKCRAIPAFVNQIMTQDAIELNRQYLVQFIKDSSAGFYVKNVQLTQEMFAKQLYISGTVLSGLLGLISRVLLA